MLPYILEFCDTIYSIPIAGRIIQFLLENVKVPFDKIEKNWGADV